MTTPEIVLAIIFALFLTGCGIYIARARGRNQTRMSAEEDRRALQAEQDARVSSEHRANQ